MDELELPDLFTTAARASINERCASAFLHDVRGTMQALFSAFELLGRSAKMGGENSQRVERACDLARRAITRHEKSTLDVLQLLTLQPSAATTVELGGLIDEVTHLLRNEAATNGVPFAVDACPDVTLTAPRATLQILLLGLVTAAIDETPQGTVLNISVRREGADAVITIGSHSGFGDTRSVDELLDCPVAPLHSRELTLVFARQFLADNAGRLEIDCASSPTGAVRLYYPALNHRSAPDSPIVAA